MRSIAVGGLAVFAAAVLAVYGLLAAMALAALRDWLHERFRVWRMSRSGEPKRIVAPTRPDGVLILATTWVQDEDGNVIDSAGNSWTVTG